MASKERIQRLKEETRIRILEASLDIVKEEGWQSLSMRKIADRIEYTAPIIYEYFANKDAILNELTRQGFVKLALEMDGASKAFSDPSAQLEAMWLAYWNFAFANKELYQVMYGVEMNCCVFENSCPDIQGPSNLIWDKITELVPEENRTEDYICTKYYTFWSVVHGLISINMTRQTRQASDEINKQVLKDAISGIINSMK
ncbi:MAG: TetR/AcrR family transcriptional regulator [Chitinophagaceae bacterium]|nr:MAG: TetR/AcrR family transcriptional regulator [Chitinophagaceae bacterium]